MTGIVIAPLYHPVLLAKLVATVDVISHGRLDFGIGISGQRGTRVEYDALGIPVETRGRRVNEMLQVMKRLWTEEQVTHHGDFFDFEGVTLLPRPVQKPHPPIWMAGRSNAAMRRAATQGDGWYPYLFTVRRLRSSIETVSNYATEAGRDLAGFHWGVLQPTVIGDDRTEALALAVAKVGSRYATPERSAEDIAQALCIAGTAQDCIKGIEERVEAGVRDFDLMLLAEDEKDLYRRMESFARLVLPHFRQ
jgi:probable F420-dependent oxidoreductase